MTHASDWTTITTSGRQPDRSGGEPPARAGSSPAAEAGFDTLPLLLTVAEAAEVLRIGRTTAYALAEEYELTQGRAGLPVVRLGRQFRVPRAALAELATAVVPADRSAGRPGTRRGRGGF